MNAEIPLYFSDNPEVWQPAGVGVNSLQGIKKLGEKPLSAWIPCTGRPDFTAIATALSKPTKEPS